MTDSANKIVANASGGWNRQDGLKVMQDFLGSGREFSVVYAMNEEMMAGAIQALEEAGRLGDYTLYSSNGKEIGWQWMRDGVMAGTIVNTPTVEADLIFQMVQAHFKGIQYPRHVYNIQPLLTVDSLDRAIPWNIKNYIMKKKDGSLVIDISTQSSVSGMLNWKPVNENR